MDGYEFIKQLRRSPEFKDAIVIVSFASVFETDQHLSLRAGAMIFCQNPCKPVNF